MKISPYLENFDKDEFYLDLFITNKITNVSNRISFLDEDFDKLVELLLDLFPPKNDTHLFNFKVDEENYTINKNKTSR